MDEGQRHEDDKAAPRINDVAQAAGVSTATVSRVLSGPGRVSSKTRDKVLAAVAHTGYRLNYAARNLRSGRTGGIVVLVPHLSNPFFSAILSGIARVASGANLNVLVADTAGADNADRRIIDYLDNNRADGLIVLDGSLPEELFATDPRRPPIVFACEWPLSQDHSTVTIDNRAASEMAVGHLIGLGHRDIGHLSGPPSNVLTHQRCEGYRNALAKADLSLNERWLFDGDFTLRSGVAAAHAWLSQTDRPSAIFCASDAMACGFMSELNRHGRKTPGDVSVVGFDDIDIAGNFIPALTTIRQPRMQIGETSAQMLIDLLRGADNDEAASRVLPVELIVRDSTSAPR